MEITVGSSMYTTKFYVGKYGICNTAFELLFRIKEDKYDTVSGCGMMFNLYKYTRDDVALFNTDIVMHL